MTSTPSSRRHRTINGTLTYDQALADYFRALLAAHDGDASAIWSIDGVHLDHLPAAAR